MKASTRIAELRIKRGALASLVDRAPHLMRSFGRQKKQESMTKPGYVYLMANRKNGKTYLGVTSNLSKRVYEHQNKLVDGYSKEKDCTALVWFETYDDIQDARAREWKLKKWKRSWKLDLINEMNSAWRDLSQDIA